MLGMLPLLVSSQEQSLGTATVAMTTTAAGALQARRPLAGSVAAAVTAAGRIQARRPLAGTVAVAFTAEDDGDWFVGPGRATATVRPALKATAELVP